jgi:redox-sensitive bicupin YhaK (pirin superfamily)
MRSIRRSDERGLADLGWLKSRHTFSFGHYYDAQHMGFGPLRVINEDRVAPGQGFGKHPHQDMEILSWVLDGALEHKDTLGTGAQIHPGELQRMRAGTGVAHSEFNASASDSVHFLQIWILPQRKGLAPGYAQRAFAPEQLRDRWCLLASGDDNADAVHIAQDVNLYAARPGAGTRLQHTTTRDRLLWLQVARGEIAVDGEAFGAGDGIAWTDIEAIDIEGRSDAEILLFDMTP